MRRSKANSFHALVPIGNSKRSGSDASIDVPGGSRSQRRLRAPSLQSGYCGANAITSAAIVPVAKSA
jgi:hypothetical protein